MNVKHILVPKEQIKALKEGAVTFYAKCISGKYTGEEQNSISGKYVLGVIGTGALLIGVVHFFHLNGGVFMLVFAALVIFAYQIMNSKLTRFEVVGKGSFNDSALIILDPDYRELKRIPYSEIGEIKSKGGNPHNVFRGSSQSSEYQSLHVTFYLKDETTYTIELSTELARIKKNEHVKANEEICLEDLLRMLYEEYRIVDESYYRNRDNIYW